MTLTTLLRSAPSRRLAAACGTAVLVLTASACGSDDNQSPSSQSYQGGGPQNKQGGPDTSGDGTRPGANGKVAAVDGSTAQVQGTEGQVAVTWNGSTTFTKEVSATLADIKVGSCVAVEPSEDAASSSTPATKVAAASVRITAKTNGSCNVGIRGPGGPGGPDGQAGTQGGPELNGTPPSGAPSGGSRPQVRSFGGAVGEVTAVSSTGFIVDSVMPGSDDTTAVTVTVGAETTYRTTASGAATDVKVGVCVVANGTTDQTGSVTAKTIAVSQPVDGQCGGLMKFKSGDGPSTQES